MAKLITLDTDYIRHAIRSQLARDGEVASSLRVERVRFLVAAEGELMGAEVTVPEKVDDHA